jgi:hypothetical protein
MSTYWAGVYRAVQKLLDSSISLSNTECQVTFHRSVCNKLQKNFEEFIPDDAKRTLPKHAV